MSASNENQLNDNENDEYEPEINFEPVIRLPLVERVTLEEDEDLLLKLRAKLYRFDSPESIWKERGTGEIKLLHHSKNHTVRVVMRRDKTLKICANHFITPIMKLQRPTHNKTVWWIWTASADFADEESKSEIFAIKFASEENANLWKSKFLEAQTLILNKEPHSDIEKSGAEDKSEESSVSESENFEDALDKSIVTTGTEGLSESLLTLDISK